MLKHIIDVRRCAILCLMVVGALSCKNRENVFPDYDYTAGYFPYQYPVRILVLGNYIYDNRNDNQHKFVISATMGGVYKNRYERIFNFVVDESLCDRLYFDDDHPILPLPKAYYKLSDERKIVIPAGKMSGGIEVQLSEAFFDDENAIRNTYVVPLRITSVENLDRLLENKSFTLFAVKYVNPFHGSYLRYGEALVKEKDVWVDDSVYKAAYTEQNEVLSLLTTGRKTLTMHTSCKTKLITGFYDLKLTFASENYASEEGVSCVITAPEGVAYKVSGTGKYGMNKEEFGGEQRDAIYLEYIIEKDNYTYFAKDTLVFRDKGVNIETYHPNIK